MDNINDEIMNDDQSSESYYGEIIMITCDNSAIINGCSIASSSKMVVVN